MPSADGGSAGAPSFPVTGINSAMLTVTGVEPGNGPFSGGTTAVIRGSGFADGATVRIGGIAVQPSDVTLDGHNRINVVVPAGTVGPADVTVTQGDQTVTLPGGFVYSGLEISPAKGAAAGGTLVDLTLSGATFSNDSVVTFDGVACTDLNVMSPQTASCKTPAHATGTVDVVEQTATQSVTAAQAFEYVETLDASSGGLSGGPIAGNVNVTVLDGAAGNVIPGALVLLGNDPKSAQQGLTDQRGAITFSAPDLKGPVTVHASAKCYERGSIVSFDAQNVTVFLNPILDLSCASQGQPSSGRKQLAATVSGQLVFPGSQEFSANSWDIVPKPLDNEARVAYVYTTQASLVASNPDPGGAGMMTARLVEGSAVAGSHGYLYRITARPAGLAVYALAGIERLDTHAFTPYVMGIAHNVVTSPGAETKNVDISMTITLDRELDVSLADIPQPTSQGPNRFKVRAYVDLGGEGLIVREVNGVALDELSRDTGSELFRFLGQPAFVGGLSSATYYVLAGEYSSDQYDPPLTSQKRSGVPQSTDPVRFDHFLSLPVQVAPAEGGPIPADRTLRFSLDGPTPDLILVEITGGDGSPLWELVLPGTAREIPIPDLSSIDGQTDLPTGFINWDVTAVNIDDFNYNQFQYTYLSSRYYTHASEISFYARR